MKYANEVIEVKSGCSYCGKQGISCCDCDYKNMKDYSGKYDPSEFIAAKVNPHGKGSK
jgi:hypothetical protein